MISKFKSIAPKGKEKNITGAIAGVLFIAFGVFLVSDGKSLSENGGPPNSALSNTPQPSAAPEKLYSLHFDEMNWHWSIVEETAAGRNTRYLPSVFPSEDELNPLQGNFTFAELSQFFEQVLKRPNIRISKEDRETLIAIRLDGEKLFRESWFPKVVEPEAVDTVAVSESSPEPEEMLIPSQPARAVGEKPGYATARLLDVMKVSPDTFFEEIACLEKSIYAVAGGIKNSLKNRKRGPVRNIIFADSCRIDGKTYMFAQERAWMTESKLSRFRLCSMWLQIRLGTTPDGWPGEQTRLKFQEVYGDASGQAYSNALKDWKPETKRAN